MLWIHQHVVIRSRGHVDTLANKWIQHATTLHHHQLKNSKICYAASKYSSGWTTESVIQMKDSCMLICQNLTTSDIISKKAEENRTQSSSCEQGILPSVNISTQQTTLILHTLSTRRPALKEWLETPVTTKPLHLQNTS